MKWKLFNENLKLEKEGKKAMITLSWGRRDASELDKRRLAKAIGRIIPMVVEWNKAAAAISRNIKVETRLILK